MSTSHLSYSKSGNSDQILCLFHGFGQDRKIFNPWLPELEKKYTVYAFDLYYHGESTRPLGLLKKLEWQQDFNEFLVSNSISEFSLVGFSLGGRFAIATALAFEDQVKELFLLAPDAIYKTPWFRVATSPGLKWLFKYFMLNPVKMDALISRAVKLGIVSTYMAEFVQRELGVPENRRRVYISWNHFKPLGYSHAELRRRFKKATFRKTIILGSKDIVIPPKKMVPILDGCGFSVIILDKKHHQLIKEDVVRHIVG